MASRDHARALLNGRQSLQRKRAAWTCGTPALRACFFVEGACFLLEQNQDARTKNGDIFLKVVMFELTGNVEVRAGEDVLLELMQLPPDGGAELLRQLELGP